MSDEEALQLITEHCLFISYGNAVYGEAVSVLYQADSTAKCHVVYISDYPDKGSATKAAIRNSLLFSHNL